MEESRHTSESIDSLNAFASEAAHGTVPLGTARMPAPGIPPAAERLGLAMTSSSEKRLVRLAERLEWATDALENNTTELMIATTAITQRLALWTTVLVAAIGLLVSVSLLLASVLTVGQMR